MTVIIIGSVAAAFNDLDWRSPRDHDVFTDEPWYPGTVGNLPVEKFWHPDLKDWFGDQWRVAGIDELYTIKLSHAFWDLHGTWTKHMTDMLWLEDAGAKAIPELYDILYPIWVEKHGKKVVNLNQDKETFFTDAVKRIYDHDSIHYSVAYGEQPIYESVFKDGPDSVSMDMRKVWALPFDMQVKLFREEIYATALERWVIPSNYRISPLKAHHWAVKKTITSLTKGRSAKFVAENYRTFRFPDMNYVKHHLSKKGRLVKL